MEYYFKFRAIIVSVECAIIIIRIFAVFECSEGTLREGGATRE